MRRGFIETAKRLVHFSCLEITWNRDFRTPKRRVGLDRELYSLAISGIQGAIRRTDDVASCERLVSTNNGLRDNYLEGVESAAHFGALGDTTHSPGSRRRLLARRWLDLAEHHGPERSSLASSAGLATTT